MTIHAESRFVAIGAGLFGAVTIPFAWVGFVAVTSGQYLGAVGSVVICAGLLSGMYALLGARVVADDRVVRRTRPWGLSCRREDLGSIALGGPPLSRAWYFLKTDGSTAFTVSQSMFPDSRMERMAEFLGRPLDRGIAPSPES